MLRINLKKNKIKGLVAWSVLKEGRTRNRYHIAGYFRIKNFHTSV